MALTEIDLAILDFEGSWWRQPQPKSATIRAQLGITPARYYRRLAELADSDEALSHAPLVVLRLRRRRSERRRERFEGAVERRSPPR
jgi:Protein of unknown function (DUF3263)